MARDMTKVEAVTIAILELTGTIHMVAVIYCMLRWLTIRDFSSRNTFTDLPSGHS